MRLKDVFGQLICLDETYISAGRVQLTTSEKKPVGYMLAFLTKLWLDDHLQTLPKSLRIHGMKKDFGDCGWAGGMNLARR